MVSPWVAQPGMAGTSAQKPPSSASCTTTLIFIPMLPPMPLFRSLALGEAAGEALPRRVLRPGRRPIRRHPPRFEPVDGLSSCETHHRPSQHYDGYRSAPPILRAQPVLVHFYARETGSIPHRQGDDRASWVCDLPTV